MYINNFFCGIPKRDKEKKMRKESPLGPFSSMPLLKEGTSRVARDTQIAWM